mmetsp:Transcript_88376/g.202106  ORF Transcript_88376/g.202106 Transcript_88376/m.202106 type:complete len:220 (+) Transcript_88376:376-1035(+)
MYGHIKAMADKVKEGLESSGCEVQMYQVAETLPEEVLANMGAPAKPEDPVLDVNELPNADGIIFGVPTRFGMMAAQMKAMFDATGGLWQSGALTGKPAGIFFSTGTQGGGQETTALTFVTQLAHHGMLFVPNGYTCPGTQFNMEEIHGGSPYGAGCYAGADGSRQPSELELAMAASQGAHFGGVAKALALGRAAAAGSPASPRKGKLEAAQAADAAING